MKNLISTLILAGGLVVNSCENKEIKVENKRKCSCLAEIGLISKSKLIGCYDIDKDGDLDCIYKQDSTKRIFLYETYDNGQGHSFAGEFYKQEN